MKVSDSARIDEPMPLMIVLINAELKLGWLTSSSHGVTDKESKPIAGKYPKAGNHVPMSPSATGSKNRPVVSKGKTAKTLNRLIFTMITRFRCVET